MEILILNGPNLNLLGKREVDIYGNESFDAFFAKLQKDYPGLTLRYAQSNIEGELIDELHKAFDYDGVILNAGGMTHTSVALGDAVAAIKAPVIEVHISNIAAREDFRHTSYISPKAVGVLFGFGLDGYRLALDQFVRQAK